jgi:glycosyltransferase involved in cell wall biosynthesis
MRILQVIDSLSTGGAESLLVDLCLRWKRHGFVPEVFVLQKGSPVNEPRLQDAGIPILRSRQSSLYSPGHVAAIASAISRNRYDLVHVHLYPAQLWTAIAIRALPAAPPCLTTEHSTWNHRRGRLWCRPIDRWMYAQFGMAVCIGSATKSTLESWLGPDVCPTCVIPNGIDLSRFHRPCRPPDLPYAVQGKPTILCVGSLNARKDQQTLIRAIAAIKSTHLLLAGEGPDRPALMNLARELNTADRIHFLGVRHDIPELIGAVDLYVQPSRVDGFCLAAVEAMAGGLPAIASDVPGLRDVVGDAAILFSAGDHHGLAERIRSVLFDDRLRQELSRRSAERAENFGIESTAAEYGKIFARAADRPWPALARASGAAL